MKKLLYIVLVIAVALGFVVPSATAVTSRFSQQILPTNCILTIVASGQGSQVVGQCLNGEPQVTEVETTTSGDRFIRGIYDSANTVVLRLIFRGITYTPNTVGSPLTVAGDSWKLTVNEIAPTVESGEYTVILQSDMLNGSTLTSTTYITLLPITVSAADPGFVVAPTPLAPSAGGWTLLYGVTPPSLVDDSTAAIIVNLPLYGQMLLFLDDGTGLTDILRPVVTNAITGVLFIGIIGVVGITKATWSRRTR